MAITVVNLQSPTGLTEWNNTAISNSVVGVTTTSTVLYQAIVSNSSNASPSFVKFWNTVSGSVVLGTTAPDYILYLPANAIQSFPLFTSTAPGLTFGTALSVACVNSAGTAGTTAPSSSVQMTLLYV